MNDFYKSKKRVRAFQFNYSETNSPRTSSFIAKFGLIRRNDVWLKEFITSTDYSQTVRNLVIKDGDYIVLDKKDLEVVPKNEFENEYEWEHNG